MGRKHDRRTAFCRSQFSVHSSWLFQQARCINLYDTLTKHVKMRCMRPRPCCDAEVLLTNNQRWSRDGQHGRDS